MGALEPPPSSDTAAVTTGKPRRRTVAAIVLTLLLCGIGLPPLLSWQHMGQQRALSLSNMRRLANGLLLYSQDWDGRTMPPAEQQAGGAWLTWPRIVEPYVAPPSIFSDPANPVTPFHFQVRDPVRGVAVDSSYALNRRFWNTFGPGPFPLDNLELREQTALLVEAGPMWRLPDKPSAVSPRIAFLDYGDMEDRFNGLCPYPSPHDGRMAVIAADGHGMILAVAHYDARSGPHDPLYGRVGGDIYDWNGGHPNGETDRPPRE